MKALPYMVAGEMLFLRFARISPAKSPARIARCEAGETYETSIVSYVPPAHRCAALGLALMTTPRLQHPPTGAKGA